MTSTQLREFLKREPFRPFRVLLSSGHDYEIRDPDLAVTMKSELFIAFPNSDRWIVVPYLHISGIELVNGRARRK